MAGLPMSQQRSRHRPLMPGHLVLGLQEKDCAAAIRENAQSPRRSPRCPHCALRRF